MSEILRLLGLRPNLRTEPTIQSYSGTYDPKNDSLKTNKYDFEHFYIADKESESAKNFLDLLNKYNSLSANSNLSLDEQKKSIFKKHFSRLHDTVVSTATQEIGTNEDMANIRKMANMVMAYSMTGDGKKTYHWNPNSQSVNMYPSLNPIFDKMRERYHHYVRERKKGWYYFLEASFTNPENRDIMVYKVEDGVYVPLVLHRPELSDTNFHISNRREFESEQEFLNYVKEKSDNRNLFEKYPETNWKKVYAQDVVWRERNVT